MTSIDPARPAKISEDLVMFDNTSKDLIRLHQFYRNFTDFLSISYISQDFARLIQT